VLVSHIALWQHNVDSLKNCCDCTVAIMFKCLITEVFMLGVEGIFHPKFSFLGELSL